VDGKNLWAMVLDFAKTPLFLYTSLKGTIDVINTEESLHYKLRGMSRGAIKPPV